MQPPPHPGDGKTICPSAPEAPSLLSHCASFQNRASNVRHDLSFVFLSSPSSRPFGSQPSLNAPIRPCAAIDKAKFYKTFNQLVLRPYQAGTYLNEKKRVPLLFDSTGKVLVVKSIKYKVKIDSKMPSSCKDIRAALAACLQSSDCIMIQRHTPAECLRPPLLETMPTKCQQLKKGYGECKRGMVDMRKRFRGNQPVAVSKELEGGPQEPSHQLYAGKPAFSGTVKVTEGREPEEKDWRELENDRLRREGGGP